MIELDLASDDYHGCKTNVSQHHGLEGSHPSMPLMVLPLDAVSPELKTDMSSNNDTTDAAGNGTSYLSAQQAEYHYGHHIPSGIESIVFDALPHMFVSSEPEDHRFMPELYLRQNERVESEAVFISNYSRPPSHHELMDQTQWQHQQSESAFIPIRDQGVRLTEISSSLDAKPFGSEPELVSETDPITEPTYHRCIIRPYLNGSLNVTIIYEPTKYPALNISEPLKPMGIFREKYGIPHHLGEKHGHKSLFKFTDDKQRDHYYQRMNRRKLQEVLGLQEFPIEVTLYLEKVVVEIVQTKLKHPIGHKTWMRETTPMERVEIIDRLLRYTAILFPNLDRFHLDVILRRASYFAMQTNKRKERRHKEVKAKKSEKYIQSSSSLNKGTRTK